MGFYDILNMWFNPLSNMFIPALVLIATGYFFTKVLETKKSRLIGGGAMIFAFVLSAILLPFAQNYINALKILQKKTKLLITLKQEELELNMHYFLKKG